MDALQAPAWVPAADADQWREDVLAWASGVLAGAGRPIAGAPAVHKRAPWSIVLQLPTDDGPVWFKQNVPTLGPEPALLRLLSERVPGRVPTPLGADPDRGWLLLPDHGPTLRARGRDDDPALGSTSSRGGRGPPGRWPAGPTSLRRSGSPDWDRQKQGRTCASGSRGWQHSPPATRRTWSRPTPSGSPRLSRQ